MTLTLPHVLKNRQRIVVQTERLDVMSTDNAAPSARSKSRTTAPLPDQNRKWLVEQADKFGKSTSREECDRYLQSADVSWILQSIALETIVKYRRWGDTFQDFNDYCLKVR